MRKIPTLLGIIGVFLTLIIFTGKFLALENGFSSPTVKVGGETIQIQPVADSRRTGTKIGLPLFEMRDLFFIGLSYECSGNENKEIEIVKNGTAAIASETFRADQRCYKTFRSRFPMVGALTVRLRYNGQVFEKNVDIQRKTTLSCPLWDMLMSV
jgi:hypothetical protein